MLLPRHHIQIFHLSIGFKGISIPIYCSDSPLALFDLGTWDLSLGEAYAGFVCGQIKSEYVVSVGGFLLIIRPGRPEASLDVVIDIANIRGPKFLAGH